MFNLSDWESELFYENRFELEEKILNLYWFANIQNLSRGNLRALNKVRTDRCVVYLC